MKDSIDFEGVKTLFVDTEENEYYVPLSQTQIAYNKLVNSLNHQFKIILIFGRPGTGKSFILQKFFDDFNEKYTLFYFKEPLFTDFHALRVIYERVSGKKAPSGVTRYWYTEQFTALQNEHVYILLDEAQLYDEDTLEWIRLLSNQSLFRFVISVHHVNENDLLAKEHFKTRTFETIHIGNLAADEIGEYIEYKLMYKNESRLFSLFSTRNFRRIHKITGGNLRDVNRLLHRTFDILQAELDEGSFFFAPRVKNKHVDMAAIDLRMIDA